MVKQPKNMVDANKSSKYIVESERGLVTEKAARNAVPMPMLPSLPGCTTTRVITTRHASELLPARAILVHSSNVITALLRRCSVAVSAIAPICMRVFDSKSHVNFIVNKC